VIFETIVVGVRLSVIFHFKYWTWYWVGWISRSDWI